jgi:3',5'-cyclic AMP phosphodiesterase CpdA
MDLSGLTPLGPRPFVIAHVSDLHASTFGDTFHDGLRLVRRSAKPVQDTRNWELAWGEAGWRVLRERGGGAKLRLLDPEGFSHSLPTVKAAGGLVDPVERAAWKACRLEARTARTLASSPLSDGALAHLLAGTPNNANLRLLAAARALDPATVDAVVVTGDVTDDGDGYELVEAAFRPWILRGRFFVVPGNHDRFLFPLPGSGRPRPTAATKKAAYAAFAARVGLALDETGAFCTELPEAEAVLVGLDSCAVGQPRFYRHNGAIGPAQLAYLAAVARTPAWKNARHRLVALHHHVVPLAHGVGKRAPSEFGMRLDDAPMVAAAFDAAGVTLVLHGHRHVSEQRQPAGCRFTLLASPSFTLGCRSGDRPSWWKIALGEHARTERVLLPEQTTGAAVAATVPVDAPSGELPLLDDEDDANEKRAERTDSTRDLLRVVGDAARNMLPWKTRK